MGVIWCIGVTHPSREVHLTKAGEESRLRLIPGASHPLVVQTPAFMSAGWVRWATCRGKDGRQPVLTALTSWPPVPCCSLLRVVR